MEIVRDIPTMAHPDVGLRRARAITPRSSSATAGCRSTTSSANPGDGFVLAQQRLGGGRIHHAMRWLGQAQRSLEIMCERAVSRESHGKLLGQHQMVQDYIALSHTEIEAARLLTFQTAWKMDKLRRRRRARPTSRHGEGARVEGRARRARSHHPGVRRARLSERPAGRGVVPLDAFRPDRRRSGRAAQECSSPARCSRSTRRSRAGRPSTSRVDVPAAEAKWAELLADGAGRRMTVRARAVAVLFDFAGTLFSDRALRDVHLEQLRFVATAAGAPHDLDAAALRAAYRHGMGVSGRALMGRSWLLAPRAVRRRVPRDGRGARRLDRRRNGRAKPSTGSTAPPSITRCCAHDVRRRRSIALRRPRRPHADRVEHRRRAARSRWCDGIGLDAVLDAVDELRTRPDRASPTRASTSYALAEGGLRAARRAVRRRQHRSRRRRAGGASACAPRGSLADAKPGRDDHVRGSRDHARSARSSAIVDEGRTDDRGPRHRRARRVPRRPSSAVASPLTVEPMVGGGSCEIFAVDRGGERWVLRRAPRHASSSTAHDVLREYRILDAIKDEPACASPTPIAGVRRSRRCSARRST